MSWPCLSLGSSVKVSYDKFTCADVFKLRERERENDVLQSIHVHTCKHDDGWPGFILVEWFAFTC